MTRGKWLALLLIVCALVLTACGEKEAEKSDYAYVFNSTGEWVRLVRYNGEETQIVIPDTLSGKPVKEIGANTFSFSPQITQITIPAGITKIDDPSFCDLPNLAKITVAEDNVGFAAVDDVLFHKKMKTVYCYPQGKTGDTYALPATITTIGSKAFYRSGLKEITLPDAVTKILASAFEGSGQLKTVTLPQKLSQIYESAFAGCGALESVAFPEKLTSIAANSFKNCVALKEIVVPANVGVMDAGAFDGCRNLKTAEVRTASVQRVSDRTFRGCESLETVTYAGNILGIGEDAFAGCAALRAFALTDSITTVGRRAFAGCESLEDLYIPDTLLDIGAHALDGTPYQAGLAGEFAVTGGGVLLEARGAGEEITVPQGVSRVAFTRADVKKVTVPEGVTALNSGAFADCASLETIVLPPSMTAIGAEAFKNCAALTEFTVPQALASLGEGAFMGCTGMKEYSVAPGNTTYMADKGVLYDNSRKTLIWYPSASEMTSYAMPYGPVGITDHAIENAANLESFDASGAQEVQTIGDYVFANCAKLKSVKFTENFSRFGAHAFEGCAALSDFKFTAIMTVFDEYAFAGCTALGNQQLSASLGKITAGALEGTTGTYTVFSMSLGEEYVKTWNLNYTRK